VTNGMGKAKACCQFTAIASMTGADCVMIPGAMKNTASFKRVNTAICGNTGLATKTTGATTQDQTVCSNRAYSRNCYSFRLLIATSTPFRLNYITNAFESIVAAISEGKGAMGQNPGFQLQFTMDATNCGTGTG